MGTEKSFQLEANIRFQATDIDDAFTKLAQHLQALADGAETEPFFSGVFQLWVEDPNTLPFPPEAKE